MSLKKNIYLILAFILFAIAPIPIALMGNLLANWFKCSISGLAVSCPNKEGLSSILTTMVASPWYLFYTVPMGGSIAGILLIILLINLVNKK
jgi:hypothetical protein